MHNRVMQYGAPLPVSVRPSVCSSCATLRTVSTDGASRGPSATAELFVLQLPHVLDRVSEVKILP